MINKFKTLYHETLELVGAEVFRLVIISVFTGLMVFAFEYLFIIALQGFFISLDLLKIDTVMLPNWYPQKQPYALVAFGVIGALRALAIAARSFIGGMANQAFLGSKRKRLAQYALEKAGILSSHTILSVYSEVLSRVGSVILICVTLIITSVNIFLLGILALKLAPKEMILGMISLFIFVFPSKGFSNIIVKSGRLLNEYWQQTTKNLLIGMKHHYFLKAHGLVGNQVNILKNDIEFYQNQYKRYYFFSSIKNTLPSFYGVIIITVLTYLSINVFNTPVGNIIPFLYIFLRISQSGSELSTALSELKLNKTNIKQLREIDKGIKTLEEQVENNQTNDTAFNDKVIEFKLTNVSFSYDEEVPLIKDLNLEISKGDKVVIQGESGSGKSTIVSLLLGVNTPIKGEITLNDKEYVGNNLSVLKGLAYVGPEPFLFEGTIKENLIYGHPNINSLTDEQLWDALRMAKAFDFVNELDEKLDQPLNETAALSTGQKQRLSLARAVLRHPKFLILDEATANLDQETETQVMQNILDKYNDIGVVIVTHKKNLSQFGTKHLFLDK
ncbi:MAG: ABC transporter ATP-binding protein [Halobacteriovoraceae bacterium]|nr:ABC transporter ATP-binding protein [Halobacteriovoraceae bacterium]